MGGEWKFLSVKKWFNRVPVIWKLKEIKYRNKNNYFDTAHNRNIFILLDKNIY